MRSVPGRRPCKPLWGTYAASVRVRPVAPRYERITPVREPTRSFHEKALAHDSEVVAPTIQDRERILWAAVLP